MAYPRKKTPDIPGTKAHQRYYVEVDGKQVRVPGGSTIAGYADAYASRDPLKRWANHLGLDGYDCSQYVDKLAGVGTLTHAMSLEFLRGKSYEPCFDFFEKWIVEEAKRCFAKFEQWASEYEFEPISMEESKVSKEYRHGGTVDFYGNVRKKGGTWRRKLLDWKTSKGIFNQHWYQVAGYDEIWFENGMPSDDIGILRIGRNVDEGFEFKEKTSSEILPYWKVYQKALEMYWAIQNLKGAK